MKTPKPVAASTSSWAVPSIPQHEYSVCVCWLIINHEANKAEKSPRLHTFSKQPAGELRAIQNISSQTKLVLWIDWLVAEVWRRTRPMKGQH